MEKATALRSLASAVISIFLFIGLSTALTACGGGGGAGAPTDPPAPPGPVAPGPVTPPQFVGLQSFAAAAMVFGQPDFTSDTVAGDPSDKTLLDPAGVAVADDGRVFIADKANKRVLASRGMPSRLGQPADFVLGQPDLFSDEGGAGDYDHPFPEGVSIGAGMLAVVDSVANRVLIYDSIPTDGAALPAVVVGQQDFRSRDPFCSDRALSSPTAVHITRDGKLIVADTGNSRVLIWKSVPRRGDNGKKADVVLGQSGFLSCQPNAGNTAPGRATMNRPGGIWSDGTRLMVADTLNRRVLLWDALTLENGQEPDKVLGQPGFDSANSTPPGPSTLAGPRGVASNGKHVAVSDTNNHRVLLWNDWPSQQHGQAADVVIGQRDFFLGTHDDADGNREADESPTAQTMDAPYGLTFFQDKLLVVDENNFRLLIFQSD